MIYHKPYKLRTVVINPNIETHRKFWTIPFNYSRPNRFLYEVYGNFIHYDDQADINIVQKIDLIHKPFIVI